MRQINHKKINAVVIPLLVITLCLVSIVIPRKDFSERENRYLAEFPEFNMHTLTSGAFTEGIKDYLSDHFPFRDKWIEINTRKSLLQGKTLINGVFFAADDYLIEQYETSSYLPKINKIVNKFVSKVNVPVYFMAVPTSIAINENKLPEGAPNDNQLSDMKELASMNASFIDISEYLKDVNEETQLYYRLDHHWTLDGAFTAYAALRYESDKAWALAQSDIEFRNTLPGMMHFDSYYIYLKEQLDYDNKVGVVSDSFKGTLFNKVGECGLGADCIKSYDLSDINYEYVIGTELYSSDYGVRNSLYNEDALKTSDQYGYFIHGNNAISYVINNDNPDGKNILIIKDSYANSLVPFLVKDYASITIIDPRYYNEAISDYVNNSNVDEVLFVYNMNTLGTDLGIRTVK